MYDPLAQIAEQHRLDLMQQAEQDRLAKQIRIARKRPAPVYRHPLAAVGRRLSIWGDRLQTRYGDRAYTMLANGAGIR